MSEERYPHLFLPIKLGPMTLDNRVMVPGHSMHLEEPSGLIGERYVAYLAEREQELAEIKQVSASALETAAENNRLTELNARLREELDDMVAEMDALRDDAQQRWLLIGGGLVLLGLVLGIGIKARPRRSAWS